MNDLKIKMKITWKEGIDTFLDKLKTCTTREEVYDLLIGHMQITFLGTKELGENDDI